MPWITFDCFGTLVDWHTGFERIVRPLAGARTPQLLQSYHGWERRLEQAKPHRLYADVLAESLAGAARDAGVDLPLERARSLPRSWQTLPVFDDVEPMLAGLRRMGYRLGVLTNCDEALFDQTARSFQMPFDLVVTAERVGDYKPSLTHFRSFAQLTAPAPGEWIHVACSWYHDIAPAREMGLPRIWLDRDRTGENESTASARVTGAAEVCGAVETISRCSA
jgi:2-haloacid dehalogenase